MNEPITSAGPWRPRLPTVWRECFAFVRAPTLERPRERFGLLAVGAVLWLLLLDVLFDLPLAQLLGWLSKRATLETPQLTQLTGKGPLYTFLMGALVAPFIEETLFRGWLDGRKRHLVFVPMLLLTFGALWALGLVLPTQPLVTAGVGLTLLVATIVLTWRAGTDVPGWFRRYFPAFYFLSAIAFALSHFSNYALDRPWLLVPFVLPQLLAGLIFGYARVRFGFWANLLLHASSNALFLGLMLAGV